MGILRYAICLVALACGSCGGGSMQQHGNFAPASLGAYGQPAGYYPGRGEPFAGTNAAEYVAWLAQNQAAIDDIQRRIIEIAEGTRIPGCIGQDKYTCVASLAQKLAIADEYFLKDMNIFAETKFDVNGKPVTGSKITFDGYPPNATGSYLHNHTTFFLTLAPDGKVAMLTADLPKDPTVARTQEEYDATALYETVAVVTAKTCPALGRVEVDRWFENVIKPTQSAGHRENLTEPDRGHATDFVSKKSVFCGRTFEFHSVVGVENQGFQREVFGGMTIIAQ